jgi:hypothetical protein
MTEPEPRQIAILGERCHRHVFEAVAQEGIPCGARNF